MSQSDTPQITSEQMDDLERLLRERDEARASLQAFLDRVKASGESLDFGAIGKKYGQEHSLLANACARAVWAFQAAASDAAPALVAEVRRLREALRHITDMYVYDDSDGVNWVRIAGRMASRAEEVLEGNKS